MGLQRRCIWLQLPWRTNRSTRLLTPPATARANSDAWRGCSTASIDDLRIPAGSVASSSRSIEPIRVRNAACATLAACARAATRSCIRSDVAACSSSLSSCVRCFSRSRSSCSLASANSSAAAWTPAADAASS